MDIFQFILNNSSLVVLAFFGFLTLYKGVPFLIQYNDDRHNKTERKLSKIDADLNNYMIRSQNDNENMKRDIEYINQSIQKIKEHQDKQKGIVETIKSVLLKDCKDR